MQINPTSTDPGACTECSMPLTQSVIGDCTILGGGERGPLITIGPTGHMHLHGAVVAGRSLLTWRGFLRYKVAGRYRRTWWRLRGFVDNLRYEMEMADDMPGHRLPLHWPMRNAPAPAEHEYRPDDYDTHCPTCDAPEPTHTATCAVVHSTDEVQ